MTLEAARERRGLDDAVANPDELLPRGMIAEMVRERRLAVKQNVAPINAVAYHDGLLWIFVAAAIGAAIAGGIGRPLWAGFAIGAVVALTVATLKLAKGA